MMANACLTIPYCVAYAETMWQQIPLHFSQVSLDASVVMPNHMHGILIISDIATVVGRGSPSRIRR